MITNCVRIFKTGNGVDGRLQLCHCCVIYGYGYYECVNKTMTIYIMTSGAPSQGSPFQLYWST